jgi:hypothetical protein
VHMKKVIIIAEFEVDSMKEKSYLGDFWCRWADNMKTYFSEVDCESGLINSAGNFVTQRKIGLWCHCICGFLYPNNFWTSWSIYWYFVWTLRHKKLPYLCIFDSSVPCKCEDGAVPAPLNENSWQLSWHQIWYFDGAHVSLEYKTNWEPYGICP